MTAGDIQWMSKEERNPRAVPGGNLPPGDPFELAAARVAAEVESADKWVEQIKVVETEEVATALRTKIKQLTDLQKELDAQRTEWRKPHLEKAADIQAAWTPLVGKVGACLKILKPLESAWLHLLQDRRDAERTAKLRVAEETQRRAQELLDEVTHTVGPVNASTVIAAKEAAARAAEAAKAGMAVPKRAQVRDAYGGPARSLRETWHAEVNDQDKCYAFFREHADIMAILHKLANAAARNGVRNPNLPGCWVYSTED